MDVVITASSEKPIYEQIYEQIASQILGGKLAPSICLSSIREFARVLGISVITVKKAYEMLEERGFIFTKAGKGCFVCEHMAENSGDKRLSLACERLEKELPYYRELGLKKEEYIELVKEYYDKNSSLR